MIQPIPSLSDYLRTYCLQRELERNSIEQLEISVRLLERFAGRPVHLSEMNDDLLNSFLQHLKDIGRSSHTRRTKRAGILCLWRAAADDGYCQPPRKVRTIKHAGRVIRAYGVDDMRALLVAARALPGAFTRTGIARAAWWESLLRCYWDTALRLSDLLRVERDWIAGDGTIELAQHKTGHLHRAQVSDTTRAAIEAVLAQGPPRSLIWPLWARKEEMYKQYRALRKAAGLPEKSSSKWIRRGSASAIEAQAPGTAWRHLGHTRPGLDRQSYLDRSICDPPPQLPPTLDL